MKLAMRTTLFFLLTSTWMFGQQFLDGRVRDATSGQPVERAAITNNRSRSTAMTNAEGKFRISAKSSDTLIIRHISYKTAVSAVVDSNAETEIALVPRIFQLDEVLISSTPPEALLLEVVEVSQERLRTPLTFQTYCREYCRVNTQLSSFANGFVDFRVQNRGAADLYIIQNQIKKMPGVALSRIYEEAPGMSILSIQEAFERAYSFKALRNVARSSVYEYTLRRKQDDEGNLFEIISFLPKNDVPEVLYEGQVIYDAKSKLILEYQYRIAESHRRFAKARAFGTMELTVLDVSKFLLFSAVDGNYIPFYQHNMGKVHLHLADQYNEIFESSTDVLVLGVDDSEPRHSFKPYKGWSLYEAGTKYSDEIWKSYEVFLQTDAEQQVQKLLNSKR